LAAGAGDLDAGEGLDEFALRDVEQGWEAALELVEGAVHAESLRGLGRVQPAAPVEQDAARRAAETEGTVGVRWQC
jgi:hypothetical protein